MPTDTFTPAFNHDLATQISQCGVIAVLVIDDAEDAVLAKPFDNGVSRWS